MNKTDKRPVLEWWWGLGFEPLTGDSRWLWCTGMLRSGLYSSKSNAKRAARRWLKRYCPNCDLRYVE